MRFVMPMLLALAMLVGCETLSPIENMTTSPVAVIQAGESDFLSKAEWVKQEYCLTLDERTPFYSFSQKGCRPEKGHVYEHNGGGLRVLQVVGKEKIGFVSYTRLLVIADKDYDALAITVLSTQEYVTDELLTAGFYGYNGTFTYTVKAGGEKTVREFIDLSNGPVPESARKRPVQESRE